MIYQLWAITNCSSIVVKIDCLLLPIAINCQLSFQLFFQCFVKSYQCHHLFSRTERSKLVNRSVYNWVLWVLSTSFLFGNFFWIVALSFGHRVSPFVSAHSADGLHHQRGWFVPFDTEAWTKIPCHKRWSLVECFHVMMLKYLRYPEISMSKTSSRFIKFIMGPHRPLFERASDSANCRPPNLAASDGKAWQGTCWSAGVRTYMENF